MGNVLLGMAAVVDPRHKSLAWELDFHIQPLFLHKNDQLNYNYSVKTKIGERGSINGLKHLFVVQLQYRI